MVTICTFKWGDKYTHEHVWRLLRMLKRNLTIPFEFAVITDRPTEDAAAFYDGDHSDIRVIPLWDEMRDAKLCGVRLRAFGSDMRERIAPRFAWIDLDVVITGNVDHIFGRTEDFIALATPAPPLAYNGSLVMMDAGSRHWVYSQWTPEAYARLPEWYAVQGMHAGGQSDEGWMTHVLGPTEARVGKAEGIYYFRRDLHHGASPLPSNACMVIFNGRGIDPALPKWQRRAPWIREHYR